MDRSIRYVRDHKVAPLLNDMLTHLLLTQAADPIAALIAYLEKREKGKPSSSQSAAAKAESNSAKHAPEKELILELIRGEEEAQLVVERAVASAPRSGENMRDILDNFIRNSQGLVTLAKTILLQVLVDGGNDATVEGNNAALNNNPLTTSLPDDEAELRHELKGENDYVEGLLRQGTASGLDQQILEAAAKQQARLVALLSQL